MDIQQKGNLGAPARASALSPLAKIMFLATALALVIGAQWEYDAARIALPGGLPGTFSPQMVRMIDLGFHPAIASFLWAATMPEFLDLFFHGRTEYYGDLAFLNAVDPKMSYPYAFSVLALPVIPAKSDPRAIAQSFTIGGRGLAQADPDWRIPYYMAINYYLFLKDFKHASEYFNVAANTPGVPDYAASFALNFGINQKERDRVRGIWETVYQSTNDQAAKDRAAAYVERLNDFDYLEAVAKAYKARFGAYPASPAALVARGIIPAVPEDPFGFTFIINKDGTAGVDTLHPPAYLAPGGSTQQQ